MASVSEQLASRINLGSIAKAEDLKKRIYFTLLALIVYRIGSYIPLPGIDPVALEKVFERNVGGILGMFDMFAGGALGRMTIFALNIMPYISASIIMQLLTVISPQLEQLKKEGELGRKKINQYARYGTVLLATVQGYGVAVGIENMSNSQGIQAVMEPGMFFRFLTVSTLVSGTLFLMWLGEQITQRGIGNGISLIIFTGIVSQLPLALSTTFELGRTGALSTLFIVFLMIMSVSVIAFMVFIERAQRRILIQYPKRQPGTGGRTADSSHLPMKINTAGVIPPIFASSLLLLPITFVSFNAGSGPDWLNTLSVFLSRGHPVYLTLYISMIAFFAFFYTAIVFNPKDTADNLKKYGGFVPGIRPGENTAEYLDYVLTRLTVLGALYLSMVCLLPELLISKYKVPFYFGGTSLLIVVSVTMDTVTQIQSYLLAHQYEGLIKKSSLRSRR
ncbi:MAG: preprotein translocase subunit SecY [Rickettsiales bacterium]|nr:preprotein translocase subunit SecY [Rickettsiales bacterium]